MEKPLTDEEKISEEDLQKLREEEQKLIEEEQKMMEEEKLLQQELLEVTKNPLINLLVYQKQTKFGIPRGRILERDQSNRNRES